MTMRVADEPVPSWARAILFWRKILALERRGIPRILSGPSMAAGACSR